MTIFLSYAIDIIIFALIAHWILGYISKTQNKTFEKIRYYLNRIFDPVLGFIRQKVKPVFKLDQRTSIDFSPLILLILLFIFKKILIYIFA